jgi:hypothetical protein
MSVIALSAVTRVISNNSCNQRWLALLMARRLIGDDWRYQWLLALLVMTSLASYQRAPPAVMAGPVSSQ